MCLRATLTAAATAPAAIGSAPAGRSEPPCSPPGLHAQCRDGSYSFSERHSGTCSGHGGVQQWNSQWNS
jgi:Protein of unknown function (DUF3761)